MTDTLDTKIRALVSELLEATPPAPPVPESGRRSRRPLALAVIAVILVMCVVGGALAAVALRRGHGHRERLVAGPGTTAGSTVIIGTDGRPTFVDLTTGATRTVSLPHWAGAGDYPYALIQTEGWLVYPGSHGAWAAPIARLSEARYLGDASTFVPSGRDGRVWLVTTTERSASDIRIVAREVSVDGRSRGRSIAVPGAVVAGVGGRLLVGAGDGLALWDPQTRQETTRIAGSFHGVSGARAAVGLDCDSYNHCASLAVINAAGNVTHTLLAPDGLRWVTTAGEGSHDVFSTDGRYLAARATTSTNQFGTAVVYVVDLATGHTTAVPGSAAGSQYARVAWAPNGEAVFETHDARLGAFDPQTRRVRTLPVACCGVALATAPTAIVSKR